MPKQIINEHASDISHERVNALVIFLLNQLNEKKIPNLERLVIALRLFEETTEFLLERSAHGSFEQNKIGLLTPLNNLSIRLLHKQPSSGYLET